MSFRTVLVGSLANYSASHFTQCNELTMVAAAQEFRAKISEAKKAMLVQYLQNIRHGDRVVYQR